MPLQFEITGAPLAVPAAPSGAISWLRNGTTVIGFRSDLPNAGGTQLLTVTYDIYGALQDTSLAKIAESLPVAPGASYASITDIRMMQLADGRVLFSWQQAVDSQDQQPAIRTRIYDTVTRQATTVWTTQLDAASEPGDSVANYGGYAVIELAGGAIVAVGAQASGVNFATNAREVAVEVRDATSVRHDLANTSFTGDQADPDVASLGAGNKFVVVWTDAAPGVDDASGTAVRARVMGFGSTGITGQTGQLLVNTTTAGSQENASVSALPNGQFVVAWQENAAVGAEAGNWGIRVQRFAADGQKLGAETAVNTTLAGEQTHPDVQALADGSFVVAWFDATSTVKARYFDADGSALGDEFTVGAGAVAGANLQVSVTADGRVTVAWDTASGSSARLLDNRPASLYGTSGNDAIYGHDTGHSQVHDVIAAGAGNDTVFGVGGNDYAYGGAGADLLYGNDGVDVLLGEDGNDSLAGGADQDYLFGGAGTNVLMGEGGVDVLNSTGLNDTLYGGEGGDYFYGTYGLEQTSAVALGEAGNDIFVFQRPDGAVSGDIALGGDGQDYFYMSKGSDLMMGGDGVDVLQGGSGRDTYDGGAGVDYLFLNAGQDTVVMNLQSGVDVVNDFTVGWDKVRLTGTGFTSFAQVKAATSDYGSFIVITIDASTAIWLVGVTPAQLQAGDFLFA